MSAKTRRVRHTGTLVTVMSRHPVNATAWEVFCAEDGHTPAWDVYCEDHGSGRAAPSKAAADIAAGFPEDWCPGCAAVLRARGTGR